jgi:hypothetical protein
MKKIIPFLIWIIPVFFSCGQAQKNEAFDNQAKKVIKDFYTDYITSFSTEPPGKSHQKKLESLQEKYCTETLLKKIPSISEQMDEDPFLKAQDGDASLLQNLTIANEIQKKNGYIVSYNYNRLIRFNPDSSVKETVIIHLTVVKENGNIKIDSVR